MYIHIHTDLPCTVSTGTHLKAIKRTQKNRRSSNSLYKNGYLCTTDSRPGPAANPHSQGNFVIDIMIHYTVHGSQQRTEETLKSERHRSWSELSLRQGFSPQAVTPFLPSKARPRPHHCPRGTGSHGRNTDTHPLLICLPSTKVTRYCPVRVLQQIGNNLQVENVATMDGGSPFS